MDPSSILIQQISEYVVRVTVDRPGALNAVDLDTAVELKTVMAKIASDKSIRAAVLTGAGAKAFVVGADRNETSLHKGDEKRAHAFEQTCRDAFNIIAGMDKPVVCAINGYALGLGVQLALACTFRIACDGATFGLPEVTMGFFPSMGATQRLTRLVGEARAFEMILTGEPLSAQEAYRIGLVHRLVPLEHLLDTSEKLAASLSQKSPVAMRLAMRAIRRAHDVTLAEGLAYEAELSEECLHVSPDEDGAFGLK